MRKFILMALAGAAIALAAPQFASATPLSFGSGLGDGGRQRVDHARRCRHRRWHRRYRHRRIASPLEQPPLADKVAND